MVGETNQPFVRQFGQYQYWSQNINVGLDLGPLMFAGFSRESSRADQLWSSRILDAAGSQLLEITRRLYFGSWRIVGFNLIRCVGDFCVGNSGFSDLFGVG